MLAATFLEPFFDANPKKLMREAQLVLIVSGLGSLYINDFQCPNYSSTSVLLVLMVTADGQKIGKCKFEKLEKLYFSSEFTVNQYFLETPIADGASCFVCSLVSMSKIYNIYY